MAWLDSRRERPTNIALMSDTTKEGINCKNRQVNCMRILEPSDMERNVGSASSRVLSTSAPHSDLLTVISMRRVVGLVASGR